MKNLVEETVTRNGQKAVIVTHSMGGLMSLVFLQQQSQSWKDKYVRALITLAAPWGGTVKTIKVFAVGMLNFNFFNIAYQLKLKKNIYIYFLGDNLGIFVLSEGTLRDQQITSPSLAWLLPSQLFWKPDEPLVFTPERNYSISTLKDFFK